MNFKFLLFLIVGLLIILNDVKSQNVKTVNSLASPNATSLGLFGEIPISLFSGTPQISFPLYEVEQGNLSVPLSLNYHASGVRPDVHPGWVGMNMNLMAGGAITRTVKGIPDETYWLQHALFLDSYNSTFIQGGKIGYFYNAYKLNTLNWQSNSSVETLAKSEEWVDTEPDEFNFTLPNGITGKFYKKEDGSFVVVGDPSIKVEIEDSVIRSEGYSYLVSPAIKNISGIFTPMEHQIKGFKITTPDGNQYEFGNWNTIPPYFDNNGVLKNKKNRAVEVSFNFFAEGYFGERYNTWYLKRIVDSNNENEILFEYEAKEIPDQFGGGNFSIASFTKSITMDKKQGTTTPKGLFKIFGPVSASSTSIQRFYSGEIILPIYLRKIITKNVNIDFLTKYSYELEYDYREILADLSVQSTTYKTNLHALTPRVVIWPGYGAKRPISFYRHDIKDFSYLSSEAKSFYYIGYIHNPNGVTEEVVDLFRLSWHKLDKIEVRNNYTQELIKAYDFDYTTSYEDRLMLLSFSEIGKDGSVLPPYLFEYENYNSDFYPGVGKLPKYNSGRTDHWGFYNNVDSEAELDFNNSASLNNYKSKRDPVEEHLYTGILNKVTYPTGGYTQYIYEPHKYTKTVIRNKDTGNFSLRTEGSPKMAGGLRIKEIKSNAGFGAKEISKKYEYYEGILGGDVQYYWPNYKGQLINKDSYTADRFITTTILPVSSNSAGSHIGYSRVIERLEGNGWTEFKYSNHHTNIDENFLNTIDPEKRIYSSFTNKDFERGKLLEKSIFNNSGQIVLKEKNIYTANSYLSGQYLRAVSTQQIPVINDESWAMEGTSYKVYTYPYNLSRTEIYLYDAAGSLSNQKTIDYSFNSANFTSEIKSSESNNIELINRFKYISDFNSKKYYVDNCERIEEDCIEACGDYRGDPSYVSCRNSCNNRYVNCIDKINNVTNSSIKAIWSLQQKNRLNEIVEHQTLQKSNGVENILKGELHLFDVFGAGIHQSKKINLDVNSSNYNVPFSSIDLTNNTFIFDVKYGDNAWEYTKYDDKGKLSEFRYQNDIIVSNIYGYNGNYLVAEIFGANKNEVFFENFEQDNLSTSSDSFTGSKSKLGQFNVSLPAPIGIYTLSYWKKELDNSWTYIEEEHTKASTSIVNLIIGSSTSKIDDVRILPKGSFMNTYTYSIGLGMTSKLDINNLKTTFHYDSFGRLEAIKDNSNNIINSYEYRYRKN